MIDKLQFLLALARERHFGRAAQACGVTQPSLSGGIKQLEEMLGVLLVNRGSRFQNLTPEGERILDWARRIVGDANAMRQEIRSLKQGLGDICASPPCRPRLPSSSCSLRPIAPVIPTWRSPCCPGPRGRSRH